MQTEFDYKHCSLSHGAKKITSVFFDSLDGPDREVILVEIVREIVGKRLVAKGRWQGKDVCVKLFFARRGARSAWLHEVRCLRFMKDNNVPSPIMLYSGTADNGKMLIVVMSLISPALSLDKLWLACFSLEEKKELLQQVINILVLHHSVGIAQGDLHWGNFLCKDNVIYTIDAGELEIAKQPLGKVEREKNLGQFFSLLVPVEDGLITSLIQLYNDRSALFTSVSEDTIRRIALKQRRTKNTKYVTKKIFRSCTEFYCRRSFKQVTICNRQFFNDIELFLYQPDKSISFPDTVILKEGNTCTVWLVKTGVRKYVVKRYNIKSLPHAIKRFFAPTRGAQSWRAAHLLRCYGIETPKPVALVEERCGGGRGRAYYISEYVEGLHFWDFFFDSSRSMTEKRERAFQTKKLFDLLKFTGIRHGDLKGQNLMVSKGGVGLIDLDDVRQFVVPFVARYWHRRDLRRFMRNWNEHPELYALFSSYFSEEL